MQVGELRGSRPQVRDDDADADQPVAVERPEPDPSRVDVVLERLLLGCDRVLASTLREPRAGAEVAAPLLQASSVLEVEDVDALGAVDLPDPGELVARQAA